MRNVIVIVLLTVSLAQAGPIGSPTATLEQGTASVGIEMFRQEQDVVIYGTGLFDGEVPKVQTDMVTVPISYGVTDRLNVFGRVGYATVEDNPTSRLIGAGARATLWEKDNLSVGMTGQFNLMRIETVGYKNQDGYCSFSLKKPHWTWHPAWVETIPMNVDLTEVIFATGITYKLDDKWTFGGGPGIYWLDGDIETNNDNLQDGSIKQDRVFGFANAAYKLTKDIDLTGECQFGNDLFGLGVGILWKF